MATATKAPPAPAPAPAPAKPAASLPAFQQPAPAAAPTPPAPPAQPAAKPAAAPIVNRPPPPTQQAPPSGDAPVIQKTEEVSEFRKKFLSIHKGEADPAAEVPAATDEAAKPAEAPKPGSKEFNWDKLKSEKEAAEATAKKFAEERDSLTAEVERLRSQVVAPEEKAKWETTAKERDQLDNIVKQLALERHPQWQAYFGSKFAAVENSLKTLVPGEAGEKLAKLAIESGGIGKGEEIEAAIDNLSNFEKSQVALHFTKAQELHQERIQELGKAPERLKQLQERETAQREAERAKAAKLFDTQLKIATEALPVLKARDKDEAWNSQVVERIDTARAIFSGEADAETMAKAAIWSAAAPAIQQAFYEQTALVKQLQDKIAALSSANPSVNPSTSSNGGGGAEVEDPGPGKAFMSRVMANIRGQS